ncbi:MAG: hypothetical protein SFY69_07925 [Planctomycetota bacterium]|nr:hypothetical protein [Planctomycetota bacterium]
MDFSFTYKRNTTGTGAQPAAGEPEGKAQYDKLRGCGLVINKPHGYYDMVRGKLDDPFRKRPYEALLLVMASEREYGEFWSNNVVLVKKSDAPGEAELADAYTHIKRLIGEEVPMGDGSAGTNYDTGGLQFTAEINSNSETWDLESGDVLSQLYAKVGAALAAAGPGRLARWDVPEGSLLVYMNESDVADLRETTSLSWSVQE